jgi:hypothetical protein
MIVVFTKIPLPKSQRVLYLVEEEWWKTTLGGELRAKPGCSWHGVR